MLDNKTKARLLKLKPFEIMKEMGKKITETDEFLDFCKQLIMKSPEFEQFVQEHGKELKLKFTLE